MQIRKLEDELGAILFDRSKKPVLATEAGRIAITQAELVLKEVKRIEENIEQRSGLVSGELVLGIIPTISPYLVPTLVELCHRDYPQLSLTVLEKTTEDCLTLLDRDEIDTAILATEENPGLYKQTIFFKDTLWLYVHPDHPQSGTPMNPDQLQPDQLWLLEDGHCLRDEIINLCQLKQSPEAGTSALRIQMGSLETVRYLVQKQSGYTLLPQIAVHHLSEEERTTYLRPFKKPFPARNLNLTVRRSHLKEGALAAVLEVLHQYRAMFQNTDPFL
jgi:LysR family hydrogen peroxide-inducible transcriptional activator